MRECLGPVQTPKRIHFHGSLPRSPVGKVLKKPITDISEAEYDEMSAVNSKSAFFFLKEAGRHLNDNGKVCTLVTSLLGAFTPFYAAYAGMKTDSLSDADLDGYEGRRGSGWLINRAFYRGRQPACSVVANWGTETLQVRARAPARVIGGGFKYCPLRLHANHHTILQTTLIFVVD